LFQLTLSQLLRASVTAAHCGINTCDLLIFVNWWPVATLLLLETSPPKRLNETIKISLDFLLPKWYVCVLKAVDEKSL
jgi:hypothetical protein